ncbi:MAG TPA: hypothetical protein VF157_05785, partial [Chloroflexota bacterium]
AAVKTYDVSKLIDNEFVNNAKGLASSSPPAPAASGGAAPAAASGNPRVAAAAVAGSMNPAAS